MQSGKLDNSEDTRYRKISDDWPVLAFAKSLQVASEAQKILYVVGHVRDPAISYRPTILQDPVSLKLLYLAHYCNWQDAVSLTQNHLVHVFLMPFLASSFL